MGRIMDRLHARFIDHEPELGWNPQCTGCAIACRKLVMMFGWSQERRGTLIPWDYNTSGVKRREEPGEKNV